MAANTDLSGLDINQTKHLIYQCAGHLSGFGYDVHVRITVKPSVFDHIPTPLEAEPGVITDL